MPLALKNNRGSVYSGRMKVQVPERYCLTGPESCFLIFIYCVNKELVITSYPLRISYQMAMPLPIV